MVTEQTNKNLLYKKLPRAFYNRDAAMVACELLGKYLIRDVEGNRRIGRIVEVEAYLGPHDRAAHSCRGVTPRTRVMFGPPGYAYVYLIYGIYCCMNVVTGREGHGAAVLIRALEPIENLNASTRGPGLLCKAIGIDRSLNEHDLCSDDFFIARKRERKTHRLVKRPRIGVEYAGSWARRHLRFYIKDNPFVSKL